MKCPKCGFENAAGIKFCGECGARLQETHQTSSIDLTRPHFYTPKFLADKILTSHGAMQGERKWVTVLFADVGGLTSLSEKLDPEDVHHIMDGCFKILMDEVHTCQGTINQFTGDGVMALFGAPLAIDDHARNGCQASLAIQKSMRPYNEELKARYGIDFKMRIGLNSGPVIVGAIGDDLRMDYTAIGDTVNLAARMESLATPGGVLASPYTCRQVSQQFEFNHLGRREVKGKEEPLDVYELMKAKEVAVCNRLFPIPYGTWQSDYFAVGMRISASYTVPNTEIRCARESIDCIASGGKVVSKTVMWNDDWVPQYPKEGTTRCGTTTMIDQGMFSEAMQRLGRKLAFFI